MFGLGTWEVLLILLILLLLFGARRLPEIGGSLGKGIREFKSSVKDIQSELTVPDEKPQIHRTHNPPGESVSREQADGEPRKLSDGVATGAAEEQR